MSYLFSSSLEYISTMLFSICFTVDMAAVMYSLDLTCPVFYIIGCHSYWIFLCNTFVISCVKRSLNYYQIELNIIIKIILLCGIIALGITLSYGYAAVSKWFGRKFFSNSKI